MIEFVRRIEILTKNILRHNLDEENLKMFLIQNTLDDQEMKKDLKMQDLKTFDEIKSRIIKCDEVKKEIEIECVTTINKPKSYARTAGLKEGQYWQQKRPQEESRYRPPQNGRAEPGCQQNVPEPPT